MIESGLKVTAFCINHPEKKTKFYVQRGDKVQKGELYYQGVCSKCAVQMIKGNIECIEISKATTDAIGPFSTFHDSQL